MVLIPGLMVDSILGHGKIITCMVMEYILGRMAEDMKATMKWIKNMGTVSINGLTAEDMREIGLTENSTGKANISYLIIL